MGDGNHRKRTQSNVSSIDHQDVKTRATITTAETLLLNECACETEIKTKRM